jgi:restriction system protein
MAVPDFQTWFLPLLKRLSDGQSHRISDLQKQLVQDLNLSEQDLRESLPSGRALTYKNRLGWARTYLNKAELIESPKRGEWRITDRGRQVLAENLDYLNVAYLKRFPEFLEFITPKTPTEEPTGPKVEPDTTPEEQLEQAYETLRENAERELLSKIKSASPEFFEKLVVELLLKMGYGGAREDAGQTIGGSGDGGIDGVINEDKLGLDVVYIQAKRWENTVGRPFVQGFAGSLEGVRARKGVFITTSDFSSGAREFVRNIEKRIVLVDGKLLANLMFDHDIGLSTAATYQVKRVDSDYFEEP